MDGHHMGTSQLRDGRRVTGGGGGEDQEQSIGGVEAIAP